MCIYFLSFQIRAKTEVDVLSQLDHYNVVRYYNCWLEFSKNFEDMVWLHFV